MVLYAVIMFLAAAMVGAIGIAIHRGKIDLIHDYHQTKVTDKAAYGKAFGNAMLVIAVTMLLSGITGLLGNTAIFAKIAVIVLFFGLLIGIVWMLIVQKKFNNGLF